jgi:hypothetical protein
MLLNTKYLSVYHRIILIILNDGDSVRKVEIRLRLFKKSNFIIVEFNHDKFNAFVSTGFEVGMMKKLSTDNELQLDSLSADKWRNLQNLTMEVIFVADYPNIFTIKNNNIIYHFGTKVRYLKTFKDLYIQCYFEI